MAAADQCRGGGTLKKALQNLLEAAKRVSSLIGAGNDIYWMISIAADDGDDHVLYPNYSPIL